MTTGKLVNAVSNCLRRLRRPKTLLSQCDVAHMFLVEPPQKRTGFRGKLFEANQTLRSLYVTFGLCKATHPGIRSRFRDRLACERHARECDSRPPFPNQPYTSVRYQFDTSSIPVRYQFETIKTQNFVRMRSKKNILCF